MADQTEGKVGVREALTRVLRDIKVLREDNEDLREQLRVTNARLQREQAINAHHKQASFSLLAWNIDNFATVGEGDPGYEEAQQYISQFMGHQALIAPEAFQAVYGLDPDTGKAVGPGLATTGEINEEAIKASSYDIDAAEAGRRAAEDGATDNNY